MRPPRIGFCRTHVWDQFEPATRRLVEDAAEGSRGPARGHGFRVARDFERLNDAHRWISSFEFARTFTFEIENHWDEISDTLRGGRMADGIADNF